MKNLLIIIILILPQLVSGQDTFDMPQLKKQNRATFLSIGYGFFPSDVGYQTEYLAEKNNIKVTSLQKPKPITIKWEKFVGKYISIGLNLNCYKWRIEYDADYTDSQTNKTALHHFIQQNGRWALNGRFNVGRTKEFYSWYFGVGIGMRIKDFYYIKSTPTIPYLGRDSEGIFLVLNYQVALEYFHLKKQKGLVFIWMQVLLSRCYSWA